VREGLKALSTLRFRYEGGSTPGRVREVTPFGILFGRSNYLVAAEDAGIGPRNWRLDRIFEVEVTGIPGFRPEDFSLQAYADESFGIYQDDTHNVVLKILPHGAEDALRWRFHAKQRVEPQPDGSVMVRFRASGMRELAWHLFTWGDKAEVVAPQALQDMMVEEIEVARRTHVRF
jgi:predicted DNA-binding transcriptional regulator YafY